MGFGRSLAVYPLFVKVAHDLDRLRILTESRENTPEGSRRCADFVGFAMYM
jgi:hypothetical protein